VKGINLIGEAADRMSAEWNGCAPIVKCDSLESAVIRASNNAKKGDVVVLSPGCSSFDMFENYEVRGDTFKDIVDRLAKDLRR
jgi:UDP-N-acetylmuramoylalanine--D-glutamate ligase